MFCLKIKRGGGSEGSTVVSFTSKAEAELWKAVIETAANSKSAKIR